VGVGDRDSVDRMLIPYFSEFDMVWRFLMACNASKYGCGSSICFHRRNPVSPFRLYRIV